MKNKPVNIVILLFLITIFSFSGNMSLQAQTDTGHIPFKTITIEGGTIGDADASVEELITDRFPVISERLIKNIIESRTIQKFVSDTTEGSQTLLISADYKVPANFFLDTVKLLWELNIPEFRSHLFQIYNKDTIYIDTWNNVVGTIKDKTYTGQFQAYRVRNWPSWKDPEKGKENLPAVPPGPKNPLGLFVVHYDENSLRYFHGTNKEYLLSKLPRNLSHGCVRNENSNIGKMKEFIIKRVIKSADLSGWMDSKRSMTFEFADIDKFPVRIIYKTFNVDKDDNGIFIELYKDIYYYKNTGNIDTKWNDSALITLSTEDNIIKEYRYKFGNNIPEETLRAIVKKIMIAGEEYEKNYFKNFEN